MPDRQRIMTFTLHESGLAVGKPGRDVLGHSGGEGAVLGPVPEPDRNIDILQPKSPWRGKDFRIGGKSFDRRSPGAALTLETSFKRDRVFERRGVARL